jgi:NAD(P)-dependent dehydrogenase (short-subunit alcohol dehydrogenase family)
LSFFFQSLNTIKCLGYHLFQSKTPIREIRNSRSPLERRVRRLEAILTTTPAEIRKSVETNIEGSFAFSHEAISAFKQNEIIIEGDENSKARGKRGFLVFTGATASLRGNTGTSALAAGKFGLRALSQSVAKEFGKENIHVSD